MHSHCLPKGMFLQSKKLFQCISIHHLEFDGQTCAFKKHHLVRTYINNVSTFDHNTFSSSSCSPASKGDFSWLLLKAEPIVVTKYNTDIAFGKMPFLCRTSHKGCSSQQKSNQSQNNWLLSWNCQRSLLSFRYLLLEVVHGDP